MSIREQTDPPGAGKEDQPVDTPLARNRNYRLLWTSQALGEFGYNATTIAYPLLVLAVTGSATASGVVLGTVAAARLLAGLPAGALADRYDRRRIMLACEAAQAVAAATLVAALLAGVASIAHMVAVAAVLGLATALFEPAEDAVLPRLVGEAQLSTAVAMNSARSSLGQLAGTGAGGFLFAVGRFVPFLVDMFAHLVAFVILLFLRVPRPAPELPTRFSVRRMRGEMAEGLRWVWGQRRIRVTTLCAVVLNLFFSAFYLVVIVLADQRGVPSGQIGVMAAMLGVGGIVGALAAPYLLRRISPYQSVAATFWAMTVLTPLAAFLDTGYLLGGLFALMALLPPAANTTILTRQTLLTPDHLRGRLSSVIGLLIGVAAAVGPVLGGALAQAVSGPVAVGVCAVGIAAVTVVVTLSPTLRSFSEPDPSPDPLVTTTDHKEGQHHG